MSLVFIYEKKKKKSFTVQHVKYLTGLILLTRARYICTTLKSEKDKKQLESPRVWEKNKECTTENYTNNYYCGIWSYCFGLCAIASWCGAQESRWLCNKIYMGVCRFCCWCCCNSQMKPDWMSRTVVYNCSTPIRSYSSTTRNDKHIHVIRNCIRFTMNSHIIYWRDDGFWAVFMLRLPISHVTVLEIYRTRKNKPSHTHKTHSRYTDERCLIVGRAGTHPNSQSSFLLHSIHINVIFIQIKIFSYISSTANEIFLLSFISFLVVMQRNFCTPSIDTQEKVTLFTVY